ncbi:ribosomal RNA assembly protein KRR1 [Pelomyxa schiedti]|nr:ribosomal RNA assembly protein KRR1 [Pelomyxa schiedti]
MATTTPIATGTASVVPSYKRGPAEWVAALDGWKNKAEEAVPMGHRTKGGVGGELGKYLRTVKHGYMSDQKDEYRKQQKEEQKRMKLEKRERIDKEEEERERKRKAEAVSQGREAEKIDFWSEPTFTKEDNPHGLLEETSFAVMFPKYRDTYLQEHWKFISDTFHQYHLGCVLDLVEGVMMVKTTPTTFDPFIIIKGRDCLRLLSRSVPAEQAVKVLQDNVFGDIIKIGNHVQGDLFRKRRQRLVGPNGATLRAIEILTGCYILVQGKTVAAMGPLHGLKTVRKIAEECMRNIHPVFNIKTLMIKRELAKIPSLAHESWDKYLPKFTKNVSIAKKLKDKKLKKRAKKARRDQHDRKKNKPLFAPPPTPRKEDLMMESGEYFLSKEERQRRAEQRRRKEEMSAEERVLKKNERIFSVPEPKDANLNGAAPTKAPPTKGNSIKDLAQRIVQVEREMKRNSAPPLAAENFVVSAPKRSRVDTKVPVKPHPVPPTTTPSKPTTPNKP